jgi:hypothetical protein
VSHGRTRLLAGVLIGTFLTVLVWIAVGNEISRKEEQRGMNE